MSEPRPVSAYVGLGANLGNPAAALRSAMQALGRLPETRMTRASSLYRSAPLGHADQPEFLNAVAELSTRLAPRALLEGLLRIEARAGRERSFRNAPRTLDLDLLLYSSRSIDEPGLQVPHPRMHERRFVLEPLLEIAPGVTIPGKGRASDWLARVLDQIVKKQEKEEKKSR